MGTISAAPGTRRCRKSRQGTSTPLKQVWEFHTGDFTDDSDDSVRSGFETTPRSLARLASVAVGFAGAR